MVFFSKSEGWGVPLIKNKAIDIFNKYKGPSTICGSIYIDPLGFEYNKSIVVCFECIFQYKESCVIFKEKGWKQNDIIKKIKAVNRTNYCEFYLIKDFSEGDNESDIIREQILVIEKKLNNNSYIYPEKTDANIKTQISNNNDNDIIDENIIKEKDFIGRLKFFKKYFYHDNACDNLKFQKLNNQLIRGKFDECSLGISFSGIDFEKIQEKMLSLDKYFDANEDITSNKNKLNELIQNNKELKELVTIKEVWSHEFFHLIQVLKCKSMNTFHKVSKKLLSLRAQVLLHAVNTDTKFVRKKDRVFDSILKFKDKTVREYYFTAMKNLKMETLVLKNFYEYRSKNSSLTIHDIAEGSAFYFQKIANRAIDISTFEPQNNSVYIKAWNYYESIGGADEIIFFLISFQSLRYGMLDDGGYMGAIPTPQQYFELLCSNQIKYYRLLNKSINIHLKSNNNGFIKLLMHLKQKYYLQRLKYNKELNKIINRIYFVLEEMKKDMKEYCTKNNIYHKDKYFEKGINPTKLKIYEPLELINKNIHKKYKIFSTEYFIPLLIIDFQFYINFMFHFLPMTLENTEFNGLFRKSSTIFDDQFIFQTINEFDKLLEGKEVYCCDKHKDTSDIKKILNCTSDNSLNKYFYELFNKNIENMIERKNYGLFK